MKNKKVYVVHSNRKLAINSLQKHFQNQYDTRIIKINKVQDLECYLLDIQNQLVEYICITNGTDEIDKEIVSTIKKYNPKQKFTFSERAWLPWNKYLYIDPLGIGNNSELYRFNRQDINKYTLDNNKIAICTKEINDHLNNGSLCPYDNYIFVPLQVNNDSKLIIGSPYFKTVESFIEYIIDTTPNDINILFRNHPKNPNKSKIPVKNNVIDITDQRELSKRSIITKSIYTAGINTTFLIESMYLNKKTVTYGLDVFSNKDIITEGYAKSFEDITKNKVDEITRAKFLQILMSRQDVKLIRG